MMNKIGFGCLLLVGVLFPRVTLSQEVWAGLQERQTVLPVGNAPMEVATPRSYEKRESNLTPEWSVDGVGEWIINGGWTLRSEVGDWKDRRFNATIPGTVLTTLVDQGFYPNPYYGLNNMAIPDSLSKMDWWYETDFSLPNSDNHSRYQILFGGINYRSKIYLNGKLLGETRGAFQRGLFDITEMVRYDSLQHLAVHLFPLDHPGIPHEQSMTEGQGLNGGATSYDGPTFIATVGWDWMPAMRDRNTGLWQDVRLLVSDNVTIGDPLVVTDLPLPDTTSASVLLEVPLQNLSAHTVKGRLSATIVSPAGDTIALSLPYTIGAKGTKRLLFSPKRLSQLRIANPALWWPNGYGAPNLYSLDLKAEVKGRISSQKSLQFGIRELSYELMAYSPKEGRQRLEYNPTTRFTANRSGRPVFDNEARVLVDTAKSIFIPALATERMEGLEPLRSDDPVGEKLVIKVNGVRIFCRGGDWGMDDAMKRSSREQLEPYFRLHREMNFNIIRNWTGESTQESFYALCDAYGMLVWNDFWMTGEDTVGPLDFDLFTANATDVVRRFRCHPSIAVWGPRNEGFAPVGLEARLSEMVTREDPTRHYHGQSRFLNMGTSGPWHYFENPDEYFLVRADGFNTEMGSFSVPQASTIRKFIAPEDRWPINDVWAYHDLHHTSQNFKGFMKAVAEAGGPESSDSESCYSLAEADSLMECFADAAQKVCYDAWRAMLEAWNSRMWDNTTGLILWMSHPAWPSFIWQTYSYDGERTGAFYGAKKACEPIHIQLNPQRDGSRSVSVINVTRETLEGLTASAFVKTTSGWNAVKSVTITALANAQTPCFTLTESAVIPIRLELRDAAGSLLSENYYD